MFQRGQFLPFARESETGPDIGQGKNEYRADHDPQVCRNPTKGQQEGAQGADHDPCGSRSSGVLRAGVNERPHHSSQRERRPDVANRGGLVQDPFRKKRAQEFAQRVDIERHEGHARDQQGLTGKHLLDSCPGSRGSSRMMTALGSTPDSSRNEEIGSCREDKTKGNHDVGDDFIRPDHQASEHQRAEHPTQVKGELIA